MSEIKAFELFNLNPWEKEYGYSAAVKIGNVKIYLNSHE